MEQKKLVCNGCGRIIRQEQAGYGEEYFRGKQEWGYFSRKDGERHTFCLCEDCYDRMVRSFRIPAAVEES